LEEVNSDEKRSICNNRHSGTGHFDGRRRSSADEWPNDARRQHSLQLQRWQQGNARGSIHRSSGEPQFTSKRDASSALLQTSAARSHATETSKLVFNRYGNQYFFSMAIIDGSGDAWKALKSRAEGSMAKLDDIRPQTATVALTRR
jgi:hypothetical protein